LLSPKAEAISAGLSSAARAKLAFVQPFACMTSSKVSRLPEPGTPMFTRLPSSPPRSVMPLSLRTTTVRISDCSENTARSSTAPSLSKGARPCSALC
jgi:hypothetical protein